MMELLAFTIEQAYPELCKKDKKYILDGTDASNEEVLQNLVEFPENYNENFFNKVFWPSLVENPKIMEEIEHKAKEMSKETGEDEGVCLCYIVLKDPSVGEKLTKALMPYCKRGEELKKLFERPYFNVSESFADGVW